MPSNEIAMRGGEHRNNYLTIRGARIIFRNFAGEERTFNPEGRRNFSIVLDDEISEIMKKDGWAVKSRPPREDGGDWFHHLPVTVSFKGRSQPKLVLISMKGRTDLDEEAAGILDMVDLENVDLIIRPYRWDVQGKSGVKAYLNEIYATIYESELEIEYSEIPDAANWRPALESEPAMLDVSKNFYDDGTKRLAIDNVVDAEIVDEYEEVEL